MGMIVEFLALPATATAVDGSKAVTFLLSSVSINSLAVAEFFTAIARTELATLIGDGSDTRRNLQLPLTRLALLMTQVQPWAYSASELLRLAFDAVETAVDEAQWRQGDLLIVTH